MVRRWTRKDRDEMLGALLVTCVLIVMALLFTGCATVKPVTLTVPEVEPGRERATAALYGASLRLIGRFNTAHACAISPRVALTNGHVLDPRPFEASVPLVPYAWSDGTGASGFLAPLRDSEGHVLESAVERARDLARVEPLIATDVFPHPLHVAQQAPVAGDRIWFLGYDWKNRKSAMAEDVIEARVTRIVALHVIFAPSGQPGSSGSCVVNEAGEVVGINEGGYETDDKGEAGLAVGVWGELAQFPKER